MELIFSPNGKVDCIKLLKLSLKLNLDMHNILYWVSKSMEKYGYQMSEADLGESVKDILGNSAQVAVVSAAATDGCYRSVSNEIIGNLILKKRIS